MSYKMNYFHDFFISWLDDWRKLVLYLNERNETKQELQRMRDRLFELSQERKV